MSIENVVVGPGKLIRRLTRAELAPARRFRIVDLSSNEGNGVHHVLSVRFQGGCIMANFALTHWMSRCLITGVTMCLAGSI